MTENPTSALRRKIGGVREAGGGSVQFRSWRDALLKAGVEAANGLVIGLAALDDAILPRDALCKEDGDASLLIRLDAAAGRTGLAIVDLSLMSSVIEMQMTGRLSARMSPDRVPTRTDGVIVASVLDRLVALLEDAGAAGPLSGFRAGGVFASRRAAKMTLPDQPLAATTLTMSLADGAREGMLIIALPRQEAASVVARDEVGQPRWGDALSPALMESPTDLRAIIARIPVPIERAQKLSAGDLLALGAADPGRMRLLALDGTPVATARLGQVAGIRAAKVVSVGAPHPWAAGEDLRRAAAFPDAAIDPMGLRPPVGASDAAGPLDLSVLTSDPDVPDLPDLGVSEDLPDLSSLGFETEAPSLIDLD